MWVADPLSDLFLVELDEPHDVLPNQAPDRPRAVLGHLNPTTTSPSTTVTGVARTPSRSSSAIAAGSSRMFLSVKGISALPRNL